MTSNYAVSLQDFQAKLISVDGLLMDEHYDRNTVPIEAGMTLRIVDRISAKLVTFQILDCYTDHRTHESHLFQCQLAQLQIVQDDLWPFVVAILDPQERLSFAKNQKRMMRAKQLEVSKIVKVSGRAFGRTAEFFDCIIRYIGRVPEIGPGHYIGLELLNLDHGQSPQKDDLAFVSKYININPELALILAVNWIDLDDYDLPNTSTKQSKKSFVGDFLCGAKEKIKRNGKRLTDLTKSYSDSKEDNITRSYTPDPVGPNRNSGDFTSCFESTHSMETRNQKRMASSVSSPNLAKQDSSSSTGSSSRIITNNLNVMAESDLRYIDSQTEDSYRSGRSSQNSSNNSTLKHSKTRRKSPKASTFRLDDRDIVIIDTTDIKEATSNESAVIIVDPPAIVPELDSTEVDLKDILGKDWPAAAGETATILNTENKKTQTRSSYAAAAAAGTTNGSAGGGGYSSSSSTSTSSNRMTGGRFERNKSPNPLSHLGNSKPGTLKKEQKMMQDAATMADPTTDGSSLITFDNGNVSVPQLSSPSEPEPVIHPSPLKELPDNPLLEVGSMVEVDVEHAELYGVIRWIGPLAIPGTNGGNTRVMVGIELEDEPMEASVEITDGVYDGVKLFKCPQNRGIFVFPAQCNQDRRFQDVLPSANQVAPKVVASSSKLSDAGQMFGAKDCPIVEGSVAPLKILKPDDLDAVCGKFKGIQGHHNSCYLDATLFSMFTFTSVFDSLLFRPREPEDNSQYEEVQRVLREEIVNPLRKNHFVRADRVMKLRQLLDRLSSVTGLTSEEKDPEEFLNSLLAQILRADPFLKLSSGLDTFYYQLFVEKDDQLKLPSVQQLFEQSFLTSNIKLKEVPSCLIIQMPRFGKNFKMYPRILPSQVLDVTDIIEDSPRQCTVCGKLAEHECRECFGMMQGGIVGLESTAFCKPCLDTAHTHVKRQNHSPSPLTVPKDFKMMADHCPVPRLFMELFAVVCIETSHYVAFVKAASGQDAPWVFFDSMADRKGEQNGYNIPEMIPVPDLPLWLSEEGARSLNEKAINDKMLPEHAKRLLCDAYMCMYQSTDVMMYR